MQNNGSLPTHLSPASREWAQGILSSWELEPHKVKLLVQAAEQLDRITNARTQIETDGPYYTDARGTPRSHPALRDEREGRIVLARLVRELNLIEEPERPRPPALRYRG